MFQSLRSFFHATAVSVLLAAGCACDVPQSGPSTSASNAPPGAPVSGDRSQRQKQADFLNRIRDADPSRRTINRALLNEQNELGLVLDRSVELDRIPDLMRTMLTQMAQEFPGEDLTVLAYAPSNPPRKIGTANLNARTRDMTWTPAD